MENTNKVPKQSTYTLRRVTWLGLKIVIFIICITCFFYQSMSFYMQYSTYPTKSSTIITSPKMYTPPAITFCDRNPVPRTEFCARFSDFCEKPKDIKKFCQHEPQFCKGNVSALLIPKFGYFTQIKNEKIRNIVWQLLLNSTGEPSWLFRDGLYSGWKITFVSDQTTKSVVKCHSLNLHISGKSEMEMKGFDHTGKKNSAYTIFLHLEKEELFYPWLTHQVFFAVHSPFVPINPFREGRAMKPGYRYNVNIRLEKEHLLPPPYQTNCTDYEAMRIKNNKTGPRSQQMCRDICVQNFYNVCYGCEKGLKMFEKIENMCSPLENLKGCQLGEKAILRKSRDECKNNCKVECLRFNYPSTIEESVNEPKFYDALGTDGKKMKAAVVVYIRDPEVIVISHDPLYSDVDLFSHIGGLVGCWLGISVWAFANIIEGTVLMATNWMKKFRKKKKKIIDNNLFYPTHINI